MPWCAKAWISCIACVLVMSSLVAVDAAQMCTPGSLSQLLVALLRNPGALREADLRGQICQPKSDPRRKQPLVTDFPKFDNGGTLLYLQ